MVTRADLDRLVAANQDVVSLAVADVEDLWASLDHSDALSVREALEDVLPDLTAVYGQVSATVSADWYDEMRDQAGASGSFSALVAAPFAAEAVRANARYAIGPLFSANPDPDAALALLELETDRMVLQPGRSTVSGSVRRDPAKPRYARVPQGDPCAWCRMLAARGAVYGTAEAAGENPDSYHADCNCVPTPIWGGGSYPEGYDPDALHQQYADARVAAGSSDPKAITSEMRRQLGIH